MKLSVERVESMLQTRAVGADSEIISHLKADTATSTTSLIAKGVQARCLTEVAQIALDLPEVYKRYALCLILQDEALNLRDSIRYTRNPFIKIAVLWNLSANESIARRLT